jgi:hypothetical protein
MEKSSQIAWKIVPLRHFFPLKVVPLIEVLLYCINIQFMGIGRIAPAQREDDLCLRIPISN